MDKQKVPTSPRGFHTCGMTGGEDQPWKYGLRSAVEKENRGVTRDRKEEKEEEMQRRMEREERMVS